MGVLKAVVGKDNILEKKVGLTGHSLTRDIFTLCPLRYRQRNIHLSLSEMSYEPLSMTGVYRYVEGRVMQCSIFCRNLFRAVVQESEQTRLN